MSICFECKNAYAHKCEWVRSNTPITGWKVERGILENREGICVLRCPNYKTDRDVKVKRSERNKRIIELAQNSDLSIRKIADIVGVSDFTVAKTLRRNAPRKRKCAKCGKEFTMRGNNKQCDDCKRKVKEMRKNDR